MLLAVHMALILLLSQMIVNKIIKFPVFPEQKQGKQWKLFWALFEIFRLFYEKSFY